MKAFQEFLSQVALGLFYPFFFFQNDWLLVWRTISEADLNFCLSTKKQQWAFLILYKNEKKILICSQCQKGKQKEQLLIKSKG